MKKKPTSNNSVGLSKSLTGIKGLDEITYGGFPEGRTTLICGSAGCGKTLLAIEYLVRGITQFNEPGVFIAFEETEKDLSGNVRSLGFDLNRLIKEKKSQTRQGTPDPGDTHTRQKITSAREEDHR